MTHSTPPPSSDPTPESKPPGLDELIRLRTACRDDTSAAANTFTGHSGAKAIQAMHRLIVALESRLSQVEAEKAELRKQVSRLSEEKNPHLPDAFGFGDTFGDTR